MRTSDPSFRAFFARATERYLTPADALVDDHAPCAKCGGLSSVLDADGHCPDCEEADAEAELDADPTFVTVCDARRDGWVASMDAALTLAAAA